MADKKDNVLKYSKESILKANLDFNPDLLNVLLDDGEFYSMDEVEALYNKSLRMKEVR